MVVTTAQGFREQRIQLLDLGADDYLIKALRHGRAGRAREGGDPAQPPVEVARRDEGASHGPLKLQPASNSVLWHGANVVLTARGTACSIRWCGAAAAR